MRSDARSQASNANRIEYSMHPGYGHENVYLRFVGLIGWGRPRVSGVFAGHRKTLCKTYGIGRLYRIKNPAILFQQPSDGNGIVFVQLYSPGLIQFDQWTDANVHSQNSSHVYCVHVTRLSINENNCFVNDGGNRAIVAKNSTRIKRNNPTKFRLFKIRFNLIDFQRRRVGTVYDPILVEPSSFLQLISSFVLILRCSTFMCCSAVN